MGLLIEAILLGVLATIAIDIWATFSNKLLKLPRTNWAMVGRWLGHIPNGRLNHHPISASPVIQNENIIGWVFHYFVGVIYALIYFLFTTYSLYSQPTLLSAWIFGLITLLSPWFIMQPSLGLGICACKATEPTMVRLQNIAIHSIFGITLYYGWMWLSHV